MSSPPSQNLETAPLNNVSCFFPTFSYLCVCVTHTKVSFCMFHSSVYMPFSLNTWWTPLPVSCGPTIVHHDSCLSLSSLV